MGSNPVFSTTLVIGAVIITQQVSGLTLTVATTFKNKKKKSVIIFTAIT